MLKPYFLSSLIVVIALLLSGCGSQKEAIPPVPPPPVTFTNATLAGNYAFTANGANAAGGYTLLGILTADGNGNVTTGHTFYNSSTLSFGNFSLSGTYSVSPDGRTAVNLTADNLGTLTLDLVLTSAQHGLVVRFDNTATASGTLDKQDPSAFNAAAMAGTWVFNFIGTDSSGHPEASVGTFTVDGNSNITGGVQDTNDNGVITANAPIQAGPASVFDVVPGVGNGVYQYTTNPEGFRDFALVTIDANHIKFASNLSSILQAGDLYRVSSTTFSGSFAFALQGIGSNGSYAAGGILNTDSAGTVLNSSIEDFNNGGGVVLGVPFSGTYSVAGDRAAITLTGAIDSMAAYPSMGGVQVISLDSTVVASGVVFQQTGTPALVGSYGANLSGVGIQGKFDAIARASADGNGHLLGNLSVNDGGSLSSNLNLTGTYTLATNGRAPGTLVTAAGSLNVIYYVASSSQAVFIEVDNSSVGQGTLVQQH